MAVLFAWLERYSKNYLRRISDESGYFHPTCQRDIKQTKLWPCNVTEFQQLSNRGKQKRLQYSHLFQDILHLSLVTFDVTCFTDETCFHLSGQVNSHNQEMRAAENSCVIHEETTACGENSNLVSRVQSKIIDLIASVRTFGHNSKFIYFCPICENHSGLLPARYFNTSDVKRILGNDPEFL